MSGTHANLTLIWIILLDCISQKLSPETLLTLNPSKSMVGMIWLRWSFTQITSTVRPFHHTLYLRLACIQVGPTRALDFYLLCKPWEIPLNRRKPYICGPKHAVFKICTPFLFYTSGPCYDWSQALTFLLVHVLSLTPMWHSDVNPLIISQIH